MAPDWLSRYFRQLNEASGLRRSGCTTCGMAPPASPWPPEPT
jgi:hypothetical protein